MRMPATKMGMMGSVAGMIPSAMGKSGMIPSAKSAMGKSGTGKSGTGKSSKKSMMTMSFRFDSNTTDVEDVSNINITATSPTTRHLMKKGSRYLFVEDSEEVAAFVFSDSKGSRSDRRMLMSENAYLRSGGINRQSESSLMDNSGNSNRLFRNLLNDETSTPEPLETEYAMSMRNRMRMATMASRKRARKMSTRMMGAMMGGMTGSKSGIGKTGKTGKTGKSTPIVEVCLFCT